MGLLSDLGGALAGGAAGFLVGGPIGAAIGAGVGYGAGDTISDGFDDLGSQLSGRPQARAARDAANLQYKSAQEANALASHIYEQNRADQLPFLQLGQQNATNLSRLTNEGSFNAPDFNYQAPQWQGGNGPGGFGNFNFDPSQVTNDPGYKFRLGQGIDQVQQSAAANGSLHSGATLKGINNYAQNFASGELNNAYTRQLGEYNANSNEHQNQIAQFQNQRNNFNNDRAFGYNQATDNYARLVGSNQDRFNRLASLAGYGPTAASSLGNLGANYSQNYGNNLMQGANAQASGIIGQANAKSNAVSQGLGFVSGLAGAGATAYAGRGGVK